MSKSAEFLYLQQEEVIQCGGLDMDAYIAGAEKAFTLFEKGDCIERESPLIQWPDGTGRRIAFHPAYVGGAEDLVQPNRAGSARPDQCQARLRHCPREGRGHYYEVVG